MDFQKREEEAGLKSEGLQEGWIMGRKTRQANFEILRVLAMLMVVTMHYLIKGEVAVSMSVNQEPVNLMAWFIQSSCIVAVNVYVLISGYFLIDTKWSVRKLLSIICQVWFYSLGIPLVCLCLSIGGVGEWGLYDWLAVLFPFQMEHYWFATAYVILYLLTPVIKAALEGLKEQEFRGVIFSLLLFFSVGKSIIPVKVPTDRYGYDFGWFICLYLIAGYLRLYGVGWFNRIRKGLLVYGMGTAVIFLYSVLLGYLSQKGLPLSYAMDMTFSYNHLLVLISSLGLFYGFRYMRLSHTRTGIVCTRIAPYIFGVYLLHENIAIRSLWQSWFGTHLVRDSLLFLPHMLFTVFSVFLLGILVDYIRYSIFQRLFGVMDRLGKQKG